MLGFVANITSLISALIMLQVLLFLYLEAPSPWVKTTMKHMVNTIVFLNLFCSHSILRLLNYTNSFLICLDYTNCTRILIWSFAYWQYFIVPLAFTSASANSLTSSSEDLICALIFELFCPTLGSFANSSSVFYCNWIKIHNITLPYYKKAK